MESDILECIFDGSIKPRDLKLSALERITENFSKERIIGNGGFGTVYKGVLRNGEVAVKRIKNNQTIDEKLYRREVTSLLKVNHKNIVRFLGYCSHTEHKAIEYEGSGEFIYAEDRERLLCFEYINNGSLEKYIADELRGLQWDTRYSLIKGICEGLQYLHMKRHIVHMDLKPANILIDDSMVAKITDFGLSRLLENSQTKTTNRFLSPGYTAPEYIDSGSITVKCDVYSLGIIIIELVTGKRSVPDSNNVLRRWSHRWHRSGKETPFRYQQIAKLIEIGLLCQENDPYKRPFISDIISDLNELERTDRKINNANESTVGLISPYLEDDMLGIEPLMLQFPIELNTLISTSLEITNETNACFAFIIETTSPLPYFIQPNKHIVSPRSKYSVNITLQPLDHAPQDMQHTGDFIVRSTKVNENLTSEDITEDIFNREEGKLVDEVNLTITYKAEGLNISLGSLIIADTRNLQGPQESNVPQTKEESKVSPCPSNGLIHFDPPELSLPFVPDKDLVFSVNVVNNTDYFVGFARYHPKTNVAVYYIVPAGGVMPPRSTQRLVVKRVPKNKEREDMQCQDKFFLWTCLVNEGAEASDIIKYSEYEGSKELPIVYKKTSLCASDDLIQFDPPQLSFPFLQNKTVSMFCSFKIVNVTDHSVGFNGWARKYNSAAYNVQPRTGILPPQSTFAIKVRRTLKKEKQEDIQCKDMLNVWTGIVTQGVEVSDLLTYWSKENKELPVVLTMPGESSSS